MRTTKPQLPANFQFKRNHLKDIEKHKRIAFKAVLAHAFQPHPRVLCKPNMEDAYYCIGAPEQWTFGEKGYQSFLSEVRRHPENIYTCYSRRNPNASWSAQNIEIRLLDCYRQKVIEILRRELESTQDLGIIANRLNEMNVPCENAKTWGSGFVVKMFIQEHRHSIYPPARKDNFAGLKL